MPWPDDYLDSEPEVLASYLRSTGGWRAHAWQIVRVAESFQEAHAWAYNRTHKGK
jgi:endonuclease III